MVQAKDLLVGIDDGHGPQTAGKRTPYIAALGREIRENEFNKAVADLLEAELKRCGFRTLQTAPTDIDTPLTTRTNTANKAKADLLVSIHFNAMGNTFAYSTARGFSVHIQEGLSNTSKSYKLAQLMIEELAKGTPQVNRGIVKQNLAITRQSNMTAALVECGFMDDPDEALLMINKAFQQEVARELTTAICRFFGVPYKGASDAPSATLPTKPKVNAPQKPVATPVLTPSKVDAKVESIVDYLVKSGKDSSFDTREKLAKQHGIANYSGTSSQNLTLLSKLKAGPKPAAAPAPKPVAKPAAAKPSGYTGESLVDYLKSIGQDASFASRQKLARPYVINYRGTAKQNLELLNKLRRDAKPAAATKPKVVVPKVGQTVTLKKTAKTFATGQSIAEHAKGKKYKILQVKTDRVLLDGIMSWMKRSDIQ